MALPGVEVGIRRLLGWETDRDLIGLNIVCEAGCGNEGSRKILDQFNGRFIPIWMAGMLAYL
jgi:hypothetical protein